MNTDLMFSKASDNWSTPQSLFDAFNVEFNFAIDAAASPENAKCRLWFGPGGFCEDALALRDWRPDDGKRAVWLNPPYSKCREFIARAAHESARHGLTVVCLVPSRTDTRWWSEHVWNYNEPHAGVEIRFLKGRVKFGEGKNSAPFPSVVIIFRGAR